MFIRRNVFRTQFTVGQILAFLFLCSGDRQWSKEAIFVTIEIDDIVADNFGVERLQTLNELGVNGVIISNSLSLMKMKSSALLEMSKLDELLLLLAENELKVLVNVENHLNNIASKFQNNTKIADIDDSEAHKNKNIFNEVKHCVTRLISKYNVNGFVGDLSNMLPNSSYTEDFIKEIDALLSDTQLSYDNEDARVFVFIVDDDYYFSKKLAFENSTHVTFSLSHLSRKNRILQILLPGIVIIENELDKYQPFIRLRKLNVFRKGSVEFIPSSDDVSIIKRELEGSIYFLIVNLKNHDSNFVLSTGQEKFSEAFEVVASSIQDISSDHL